MLAQAALMTAGHVFRDGWPDTGNTHAARAGGGLAAIAAGCLSYGWKIGIPFGAAIWGGFYLDSQHGEGQDADEIKDADALFVSGYTSAFVASIVVASCLGNPYFALLGLAKIPIWFGCWFVYRHFNLDPNKRPYPTQIAAGLFGAVIGACM